MSDYVENGYYWIRVELGPGPEWEPGPGPEWYVAQRSTGAWWTCGDEFETPDRQVLEVCPGPIPPPDPDQRAEITAQTLLREHQAASQKSIRELVRRYNEKITHISELEAQVSRLEMRLQQVQANFDAYREGVLEARKCTP